MSAAPAKHFSPKPARRSTLRRSALAAMGAGLLVTVASASMTPAGAKQADDKVSICHGTSSVTNPYQSIEVSPSATDGPDHASHGGPVFDPTVNTSSKIPWGDIIPNGLNWNEAGQALWNNECQLLTAVVDPIEADDSGELSDDPADGDDPADEADDPADGDDPADESDDPADESDDPADESDDPVDGDDPADESDDPADGDDPVDESDDPADESDDQVDGDDPTDEADDPTDADDPADGDDPTEVTDPAETADDPSDGTEVDAEVVAQSTATQVLGVQIVRSAELPRTGSDTLPTAALGLGLVLLGAGVMLFARAELSREG